VKGAAAKRTQLFRNHYLTLATITTAPAFFGFALTIANFVVNNLAQPFGNGTPRFFFLLISSLLLEETTLRLLL